MSDFLRMQEISAEGDDLKSANGFEEADDMFENASSRKKKRQAKRAKRRAKRQTKRAKRVAKRNPKRAKRILKRARKNTRKATKINRSRAKDVADTANEAQALEGEKADLAQAEVELGENQAQLKSIQTQSGETVEPAMTQDGYVASPQVISPMQLPDGEQIEAEITTNGEVMQPEIIETNQEPQEGEDGSMQVGEDQISPEVAEDGEEFPVEIVGEEEGADGETYYKILKWNKIPVLKNADGSSIMPYKMADGSVVMARQLYASASGQIFGNADGSVTVKNPKLLASVDGDFSSVEGKFFQTVKSYPSWVKVLAIASLVGIGVLVYRKYNKK